MEIREALREFNLTSLDGMTEAGLKKSYRAKMKLEHPDLNGGKTTGRAQLINEAYTVLTKLLGEVNSLRVAQEAKAIDNKLYVIGLDDLQYIYSGQGVCALNSEDIVDTSFLHSKRIALNVRIKVEFKGATTESSQFISWNISDNYNVDVHLMDFDTSTGGELVVSVGKQTKSMTVGIEKRVSFLYNLGHNVRLKVLIERWDTDGQGNTQGVNR